MNVASLTLVGDDGLAVTEIGGIDTFGVALSAAPALGTVTISLTRSAALPNIHLITHLVSSSAFHTPCHLAFYFSINLFKILYIFNYKYVMSC